MDMQDQAIYRVWIHLIFLSPMHEEKNHLVLSWNQTQVLLLHKQPLQPPDDVSSGRASWCLRHPDIFDDEFCLGSAGDPS